ncbi:glycosyltransferase family 2 protein [Thalassotalea euphylliae]|uniref:Glycosyltransferase family 2 protein n=1 Tax=Thalassotalea euphylliae TaxID=1655234 RepID=A0A3E0TKX2_9GAMM|nr:glycosyltransferase family 2 protein [Thalassotalea euphylliae]REL25211.1 glycosyltransferase family 2 protein [Thalassotalea euphylliae]
MDISLLIATYNGQKTLRMTLESLTRMDVEGVDWELLVCDNNSTDLTASILKEYEQKLPLKIYYEGQQGKSAALNKILYQAQGDILILTDDDVIADTLFLKSFLNIANSKLEYDIFGGKIEPYFSVQKPNWYDSFGFKHIAYAITPESFDKKEVGPGSIFGANVAFRRSALTDNILFNTRVGPTSGNYEMGCETDFLTRLSAGRKCWFDSSIIVKHILKDFQFDYKWLKARGLKYGLSMYTKEKELKFQGVKTVHEIPLWRIKVFLVNWFQMTFLPKNKDKANNYWEVGFFWGYLKKRFKNNK